jgi:hypothetical protein
MGPRSSTFSVIFVLLLIFTFPIWIGIAGGLFGLIAGLFGAAIGIVAGVFGAVIGMLGAIFGWLFDWNFHVHWPFAFFGSGFFITMVIVLVVVLITRSKKI